MSATTITLSASIQAELARYTTTSDKIRYLNSKGFSRGSISKILNKRYQHVRNVLTQDAVAGKVFEPLKK